MNLCYQLHKVPRNAHNTSNIEYKNYKNIITYLIILNYFYKDINILLVFGFEVTY